MVSKARETQHVRAVCSHFDTKCALANCIWKYARLKPLGNAMAQPETD